MSDFREYGRELGKEAAGAAASGLVGAFIQWLKDIRRRRQARKRARCSGAKP